MLNLLKTNSHKNAFTLNTLSIRAVILLLCTTLIYGCSTIKTLMGIQPTPAANTTPTLPPQLPPKPKPMVTQETELHVSIEASRQLNLYLANAHALLLTMFQLSDTNEFKKLARTSTGLKTLMTSSTLEAGIISKTHKYIQPSTRQSFVIKREDNATHIAIIAGYYQMRPRYVASLAPLPETTCVRPYENDAFDNIVGGEVSMIVQLGRLKIHRFGIGDTRDCLTKEEVEALGFDQPNINRSPYQRRNAGPYQQPYPSQQYPQQNNARSPIEAIDRGLDEAYELYQKKRMLDEISQGGLF